MVAGFGLDRLEQEAMADGIPALRTARFGLIVIRGHSHSDRSRKGYSSAITAILHYVFGRIICFLEHTRTICATALQRDACLAEVCRRLEVKSVFGRMGTPTARRLTAFAASGKGCSRTFNNLAKPHVWDVLADLRCALDRLNRDYRGDGMDTPWTPAIRLMKMWFTRRDVSFAWLADQHRRETTQGWETGPRWLSPAEIDSRNGRRAGEGQR